MPDMTPKQPNSNEAVDAFNQPPITPAHHPASVSDSDDDEYVKERYYALYDLLTGSDKAYDVGKIERAFQFANDKHKGQRRKSGEQYIIHPIAVATILQEYYMDTDAIVAAFLHDVIEDTDATAAEIRKMFGEDVLLLVQGVTKIGKITELTEEEKNYENIRRILMAMAKDVRVIMLKLADRLHNMRTIRFQPAASQRRIAHETMNFYTPIAHRLGLNRIKDELEDISLKVLDPFACREIEAMLELKKDEREAFIASITKHLNQRLSSFKPRIFGRVKSIYGIYKKMYGAGKTFEEIFDVYAVRIIVEKVTDCYSILGLVHDMFRAVPNRLKDYISIPKSNGYRSLHTVVLSKEGVAFEIQIRTNDMHLEAEFGVAAHWKYKVGITSRKEAKNAKNPQDSGYFKWVHHLTELHNDDSVRADGSMHLDLSSDEVMVFTPKGEVKSLPAGSTVIDFAYAIHTQVGHRMIGAKVNGREVNFERELRLGDIVEIRTGKEGSTGPNRNWLNIAKTSEAKSKIRNWLRREKREENIAEGKDMLLSELRRGSIDTNEKVIFDIAQRMRFSTVEDLFAAVGYGGVTFSQVVPRIREEMQRAKDAEQRQIQDVQELVSAEVSKQQSGGVIVDGLSGVDVHFAQCCTPLPGDKIVGFVTMMKGISIHKADCSNVMKMTGEVDKDRWVKVRWATKKSADHFFNASIDIISEDRIGLVSDIGLEISNAKILIIDFSSRNLRNGNAIVNTTVKIAGLEELNNLLNRLGKIKGVISVERARKAQ
jgi:GTP pyrophosphokinase